MCHVPYVSVVGSLMNGIVSSMSYMAYVLSIDGEHVYGTTRERLTVICRNGGGAENRSPEGYHCLM